MNSLVTDKPVAFCLEEVPSANTLWMLSTGYDVGPFLSIILQLGDSLDRFENIVLVHATLRARDLSYLPLMEHWLNATRETALSNYCQP